MNRSGPQTETDLTIVNPANLAPALRESVCQQCHLQALYRFTRAGREPFDFRPGLPIHRFWAIYLMRKGNGKDFEAVGHVEQMETSRCFRASQGQLGCISCHDPHRLPATATKTAYYRTRCLTCHEQRGCALPAAERQARGQGEDCIACHMPPLAITNIPHTAATNHRIPRGGVPGSVPEAPRDSPEQPGQIPLMDYHWGLMTEEEQRDSARDLGVALGWAARSQNSSQRAKSAATLALPLLEAAVREPSRRPARLRVSGTRLSSAGPPRGRASRLRRGPPHRTGPRVDPPDHGPSSGQPATVRARAAGPRKRRSPSIPGARITARPWHRSATTPAIGPEPSRHAARRCGSTPSCSRRDRY